MVVPLAYRLHVYAEEPWLSRLRASHQRWYTDKPSQWMDLSGKWSCVRSHSLFLQRLMTTGTRIATCRLTRAGTASWVDFTGNQSTLTAACSCCACRSNGSSRMIYSALPRDMHAATVMSPEIALWWECGLPSPPTSRIIPQWCDAVIYQRRADCHHTVLWSWNNAVACRLQGVDHLF